MPMPDSAIFNTQPWYASASTMVIADFAWQINDGHIDLNPSYQRGLVWTLEQKQALIETLSWGLGIPGVYLRKRRVLSHANEPYLEVIDGKQRLSTLVAFFNNEFAYQGLYFKDLSKLDQISFKRTPLAITVVEDVDDAQVLLIYERLNFCGVPHTKE